MFASAERDEVSSLDDRAVGTCRGTQLSSLGAGDALGGAAGEQSLEDGAGVHDLDRRRRR